MAFEMEISGDPGWPDVNFTLSVDRRLADKDREFLEDLLVAWIVVGRWGGFGDNKRPGRGSTHDHSERAYAEESSRTTVTWWCDLGSASIDQTLSALEEMLHQWSRAIEADAKLVVA